MLSRGCPASGLLAAFAAVVLAEMPEVQAAIAEAGLAPVIALLRDSERPAGQALAAQLLALVAKNVGARARVAAAALPALVSVMPMQPTPDAMVVKGLLPASIAATCAVCLLADTARLCILVADAALPALVTILQDSMQTSPDHRKEAAYVLQHLAAHIMAPLQQRIADAALPALVSLMQASTESGERLAAVETVSSLALCGSAQLRRQLHAATHEHLVLLMQQKMDIKSRKAAMRAMKRLHHSALSCWGIW